MSSISLCMIVRDEEACLAACLDSARSAVERMVVVDTGSRDRSVEIARDRGALVVRHAWADDFAAARNAVLGHVTEGWILVLDADERLAPGADAALRAASSRTDFECGLLPLSNAQALDSPVEDVLSGRQRRGEAVWLPRFLRRTPDLAWEGIVHENVDRWVLRGRRRIARLDAPIVHYGQVAEVRAARGKDARNLRLLERRVAAEPDDPVARNYLARELERCGDAAGALTESARAWQALLAALRSGIPIDATPIATLRAFLLLRARELDAAREVLEQASALEPEHPNLGLLTAALEESTALAAPDADAYQTALARAERALERCLARRPAPSTCEVLPGAHDWAAATRLGVVQLMRGAPQAARTSFERALEVRPGHPEAVLGHLEARILAVEPGTTPSLGAVLGELEAPMADPAPDAWILAALACLRLELSADAMTFAREACTRIRTRPPHSPHRRRLLEELLGVLVESGARRGAASTR